MLGAIIIDAVVFGMIDVPELRRLYRVARFDFWIAIAAILGVLSAGVLAGVVIGVVLSLGWLVYVATAPPMPLLGREPGTQVFRDAGRASRTTRRSRASRVLRLDGGLFFATAEALDEPRARARRREPSRCTRSSSTSRASTSSTRRARRSSPRCTSSLEAQGVSFRLARLKPQVRSVLEADGVIDALGADHVHGNVHRAVEAELAG